MKNSDATKNQILSHMEEKRSELLDNCTRALCGDKTVDLKLLDEATGGRFSQGEGEEAIKTLILSLRWLAIPSEKKTRRRRTSTKSSNKNTGTEPAKKRGRPKGSKSKSHDNGTQPATPPTEKTGTAIPEQPSA